MSETAANDHRVVRVVTAIIGVVIGLTFVFGFGNVLSLALRLGVSVWVAPLVAPAVDLSVHALLPATRHLALHGAAPGHLRPARRLLMFVSLASLALNVAEPVITGQFGKAAFDAVGPLLSIGWAEVGPGLLSALKREAGDRHKAQAGHREGGAGEHLRDDLLERARQEDVRYRDAHQRPIPAETLRKRLRIGATRSRALVAVLRAEHHR